MTVGAQAMATAGRRGSFLRWYREMTGGQRRTFWTCNGGHALDAMDTELYSWVLPSLIALLGLTRAEGGNMGTAA